ncbi:MAG: substrate-binding domain-containing protein, partial [Pirellulales bacterium]|nr:substrate-binding domain-containing protein [Pirellulales bacterium]
RSSEGDDRRDDLPGERKIAEEIGVSYLTARRAILQLLEQEVLIRQPSGALDVHPAFVKRMKLAEVVLLYPSYPSNYLTQLRGIVSEYAQEIGTNLRPMQFIHWDERIVLEAVEQAKGVLIIPSGHPFPKRLAEPFRLNKVVILDGDFTQYGVPSIRLFRDKCIESVLDYIHELGHTKIDFINSHDRNSEIERRIRIWQNWMRKKGLEGQLWNDAAAVYTDPTVNAYQLMTRMLKERQFKASAFLTATCPAAIGAIRACWESHVQAGRDISIATVNLEPPAEFFYPSITGLSTPDLSGVLEQCFEWFFNEDEWQGTRLLEPEESVLFAGESVGPA